MSSIVFFGKAHAGKSTLVGSIIASAEKMNLDALEQKFVSDIPDFDLSDLYSAIVDDTRNERERKARRKSGGSGGPGSTKTRHYRNVDLDGEMRVTIIDTPGAEHLGKERDRGIFAGEVGVFCLETADVINQDFFAKDRQYRAIMTALALWSSLSRKHILVALTKMDECGFQEKAFSEACEVIQGLCEELELSAEFIPTSVEVRNRQSHNLLDRSAKMAWYEGAPLVDSLRRHMKELENSRPRSEDLLFTVDREFAKPESHAGKAWQVKIISGTLKKGNRVVLSPVVDSNRDFLSVTAEVKEIRENLHRSEEPRVVNEAFAGSIVGLDLRLITSNRVRRLQKSEFNTIYTTCGFSDSVEYFTSHSFQFSVAKAYGHLFSQGRQFGLIWFGRAVEFEVQTAEPWRGLILVKARLIARPIAMPKLNKNGFIRSVLIIRTHSKTPEFIQAELQKIG